jgi:hypothetical protein
VIEGGVEAWSKREWIKDLADAADRIGSLTALVNTADDVQRTSESIPGTPVLREFG